MSTRTASRLADSDPRRLRGKLSTLMFADNVQKPTLEELEEGHHHAEHEHELEAGLDHSADGHQFDGRHPIDDEPLRGGH